MKTYQVMVQVHAPAPREFVERVEASRFSVAVKRGIDKVLSENFKRKHIQKVGVIVEKLN